jgi:hypothetical protein
MLHWSTNAEHGAHMSYLVILEAGVGVLVKPEDALDDGPRMVRREVAAWVLARLLGWNDLLATTVLREVESFTSGSRISASVQVLWPNNRPGVPVDELDERDTWRAGVFDALVFQSDRGGHNWLGVPREAPQLKLIDHGYAFDQNRGFNSAFFNRHRGAAIPDALVGEVQRALERYERTDLPSLLQYGELNGFVERAERLVSDGTLDV